MHRLEKVSHLMERLQYQVDAPQGGPTAGEAHQMNQAQVRPWRAELAEAL